MSYTSAGLHQLLVSNVVELKFTRRNPKPNRPPTRRMLASLNPNILDSERGRTVFNFKSPTDYSAYNPNSHNLIVVFDLFMQNWRAIPTQSVEVIQVLPSDPVEEFWTYFSEVLSKMSADQKAAFMDT